MSKNRSSTTEGAGWPQLASNANTNTGRKHSLPAHSFGSLPSGRDTSNTGREVDPFQSGDPGAVATFKMIDKVDDRDKDRLLGKSLRGFGESKLASGRSSANPARGTLITDAGQPRGASQASSATLPMLIDTRPLSYRDAAVKCTPPPSPLVTPCQSVPVIIASIPALSKPNTANTTLWPPPPASRERPKLDTNMKQMKQFPPLLPSPTPKTTTTPVPNASIKSSYAKCLEPSTPSRAPPVLESPVSAGTSTSPSTAKVITLNIASPSRPSVAPHRAPSAPTTPSKPPRKRSSATPPATTNALRLPDQRTRSASVSSISSTPSLASTAPTSIAPASRPWESEEWYPTLVVFARQMSKKSRRAWEKILRSDPKDTSKMKWAEFDAALKSLGFESKTRGGSDLEYSPSRFGENSTPISYHRPHPGQEFSLGDLKAKAYSFRTRYPGAVAALHEAWDLVDTRG